MNKEIKEILELKKRKIENSEAFGLTSINIQEDKLLLNYITNLQEENKKIKKENIELQDIIQKAIEYIEYYIDFEDSSKLDTKKELKELLDILKGGNNE